MVKKAKITVYCCGLFLHSILSKRAGFSTCRSNFSQGPYSNIIHTLEQLGSARLFKWLKLDPNCFSKYFLPHFYVLKKKRRTTDYNASFDIFKVDDLVHNRHNQR